MWKLQQIANLTKDGMQASKRHLEFVEGSWNGCFQDMPVYRDVVCIMSEEIHLKWKWWEYMLVGFLAVIFPPFCIYFTSCEDWRELENEKSIDNNYM